MRESIRNLKKLVSSLESYVYINNENMVLDISDEIIKSVNHIKNIVSNNNQEIAVEDNEMDSRLTLISNMDFLYKPLTKKNYYEGDYLEKFSDERTRELKNSKALDLHDKFWTSNGVEKGNVFGSIPKDLIREESINSLISYGWKKTEVSVYEVIDGTKIEEVSKICKEIFNYFLIVKEMRNKGILVLEYKNI